MMTYDEVKSREEAQLEVLKEILCTIPNETKSRMQADKERTMFSRDKFTVYESKELIALVINYQNQHITKLERTIKRIEKELQGLRQVDFHEKP